MQMVSESEIKVYSGDKVDTVFPLRIKFMKTGDLQYISHLDLNRTMQRMMIRARVPMWYSEGFNPKPKLVFAAPLSVGCESVSEFVDIRVIREVDTAAMLASLNRNSTADLVFMKAYTPSCKFNVIKYASYKLKINSDGVTQETADAANALFSAPVVVKKRTKSGEKDVDISPQIKNAAFSFTDGMLEGELTLCAESENYLNPEYLVTALKNNLGLLGGDKLKEGYSLTRTAFLIKDMSEFV